MKRILGLLLLVATNAFAFDSSSAFNVVTMSYTANTTIYQRIVLDNTQKQATTLNFTVDVKNGGGRPTQDPNGVPQAYASQTDSANIFIKLYDFTGAVIATPTSQTYTLQNWGSNAGWSNAPGDNLLPWTTASLTYTGSLANVWFIEIYMKGTDGAWWAGNYGPEWRAPTVTIGADTSNVVYNSEFGIAPNSVKAQGWFNSSNTWAYCGVTSGNAPCVTNVSGVTANMWGGGYDANGGSLAGATGGYNGTLTTSSADTAATTGTPTGGGSTTPTAPAFDGTLTQVNNPTTDTITSGSTSTAGFTGTQQSRVNAWTGSTQAKNNVLYIEQTYGTNNTVNITQSGTKNRIDFTLNGNGNVANTTQTGSNYLKEEIPGWGNTIIVNQSNTTTTNYAETKIQGNGNTVNHTQNSNATQLLFSTVTGDINTITTTQSGTGSHYAEAKLTGNFNNVKIDQSGSTANKANVDVTNAGGASTVDLQQTGGKNFTIIQSCVNAAGCSTTVRQ